MKIAILNPWFLINGGGSKVVNELAAIYPEADFFTLFYRPQSLPPNVHGRRLFASFLQKVPSIATLYRPLLPIHPLAVESLNLAGYDLVLNCDASLMKGALVDQGTLHICYCHTPGRYFWDLYRSFECQAGVLGKPLFAASAKRIRQWDFIAAQRIDAFVANSQHIARRIKHYYRRDSTVIYPPVDTQRGFIADQHEDYYLSVGRLSSTKRLDLIIQACNRLGRRLLIAGTGREERHLKAIAGPTIHFLGRVADADLPQLYANCRALLFAADEDFGIVPVEAQSFGRPVLAYGHGGSLETIIGDAQPGQKTGLYFALQTFEAVVECIQRFEAQEAGFDPHFIQGHSRQFDTAVFVAKIKSFIEKALITRE